MNTVRLSCGCVTVQRPPNRIEIASDIPDYATITEETFCAKHHPIQDEQLRDLADARVSWALQSVGTPFGNAGPSFPSAAHTQDL